MEQIGVEIAIPIVKLLIREPNFLYGRTLLYYPSYIRWASKNQKEIIAS